MISENELKKYLLPHLTVRLLDVIDSTNSEARRIVASGDFSETLIIAENQTAGRGRMGRTFFSNSGGLYMSILLKPDLSADAATRITTAAAVAVVRAIRTITGIKADIKWVNDIYLDGKKICGILTESLSSPSGKLQFAVLGIGVNLTLPTGGFPDEISNTAGYLYEDIPENAENRLAAEVVNEFYRIYNNGLDPHGYIDDYRRFSCIIGKEVTVTKIIDGEKKWGIVKHIDDEFRLVVLYPDGSEELFTTGEITMHS